MRANTDYKEEIKKIAPSANTAGDAFFDVYNEGCIITIQNVSGTGSASGSIYAEYPGEMDSVLLDTFAVDGYTYQKGFIVPARIKLTYSVPGGLDIRIAVRSVSADAVLALTTAQAQAASVEASSWEEQMEQTLQEIKKLNQQMLNHLRVVTGIKTNQGDVY